MDGEKGRKKLLTQPKTHPHLISFLFLPLRYIPELSTSFFSEEVRKRSERKRGEREKVREKGELLP